MNTLTKTIYRHQFPFPEKTNFCPKNGRDEVKRTVEKWYYVNNILCMEYILTEHDDLTTRHRITYDHRFTIDERFN